MNFIPSLILCDCAFFQLSSNRGQHFTCIIGKVKISHFSRGHRHNGKGLFVLFQCRCANLESEKNLQLCHLSEQYDILQYFQLVSHNTK